MNTKEPKPHSTQPSAGKAPIVGAPAVGKPGPFQVTEDIQEIELANPSEAPKRIYDCANYESCLELAAALNWHSFTCSGCNQQVNNNLVWRAHQAKRHDAIAHSLCSHLPEIGVHSSQVDEDSRLEATNISEKPEFPPTGKLNLA